MEHTVQNTEGTEVPPQTQRFQTIRETGIIDNPNGPSLYGVKWKKLVFGSPGPEMGAVLHARPDLCFIKQKSGLVPVTGRTEGVEATPHATVSWDDASAAMVRVAIVAVIAGLRSD